MTVLREFRCPKPRDGETQYIDISEIVAIGPLDANPVCGPPEPHRYVYLRSGAVFALAEGPVLDALIAERTHAQA